MSRLVRIAAVGVTGVLMAFAVTLGITSADGFDPVSLLGPFFYVVAVFLVLRVPDNRVSWLLLWISFGFGLGAFYYMDSELGIAISFAGNFVVLLPAIGVLLPVWFPTGRAPTPAWNWVARAGIASAALFAISIVWGLVVGDFNDDVDGCYTASACVELGSMMATLAATIAAVVSLVVRFARAKGVERQQLKLMAAAFVLLAIAIAFEFGGGQGHPLVEASFTVATLLIPAAMAVTISAYRLYDIDRIISRTVSYAIVAGLLAVVFAAVVVWLPNLVPGLGDSPLLVALGTLAVAASFNPFRRRVQRWVDRRFNRSRYDATVVLDRFASALGNRVDSDELVRDWVTVVTTTMEPSSLGVWTR